MNQLNSSFQLKDSSSSHLFEYDFHYPGKDFLSVKQVSITVSAISPSRWAPDDTVALEVRREMCYWPLMRVDKRAIH